MNTCNWTRGGIGLAVAVLAAMTVTGCDPYLAANTAAPVVLGATMIDTRYQSFVRGVLPQDSRDCSAPYPEPDPAWITANNFQGLCGGATSVCPVLCYPTRAGPAYAPFYTGNLGSTYKTLINTNFTYATAPSYTLDNVPPTFTDFTGVPFQYNQILALFNKTMDPQSIQPNPNVAAPSTTLHLFENDVEVTNAVFPSTPPVRRFSFEYNPNSDTTYWGASIMVTANVNPATPTIRGRLLDNTTYHLLGTVQDQQGNSVDVDVVVNTATAIVDRPILASYSTNPATYTVGSAITPNVPTNNGGIVFEYTVTPDLPAGLTIDPETGIITGTPTAAAATATYTVEAANGAGFSLLDVVITVTGSAP